MKNNEEELLLPTGMQTDEKAIDMDFLEMKLKEALQPELSRFYPTLLDFTADGSVFYSYQKGQKAVKFKSTWKVENGIFTIDVLHQTALPDSETPYKFTLPGDETVQTNELLLPTGMELCDGCE